MGKILFVMVEMELKHSKVSVLTGKWIKLLINFILSRSRVKFKKKIGTNKHIKQGCKIQD